MNFYLLIPATAFLVDFFLMTYLFAVSDRHRATRAYLLFCAAITVWQASEFFLWTGLPDHVLIVILRYTSPFYLSVGFLFLNFIHDFTGKKRGVIFHIHSVTLLLGTGIVFFTDWHIQPVILRYNWGTTPLLGEFYPHIAMTVMILPALTGLFLLARHYSSVADLIIRRQSLLIFAGLFFTSGAALLTNVALPLWIADFSFPRLASSLMAVQSVFIFISIVRYRLFMISFENNAYRIYNSIQDGVIILDRQGRIHEINSTARNIIGHGDERLTGVQLRDLLPGNMDLATEVVNRIMETGPDDDRRTVLLSKSAITRGSFETGALVILKDITAIRRAEKESVLYQERFTKAFNLSPIPMSINRASDTVYVDVNESQCRHTGYAREEFLGKTVEEMSILDSRREYRRLARRLVRDRKILNQECRFRMKTGEVRRGLISAELFSMDGEDYVITSTNDITDRMKMEAEIARASKIESLGVFAGGIAHDFNNLLTAIIGNISLGKIYCAESDELTGVLDEAERASLRAKDLTRQLLTFSRGGAPIRKVVSLGDVIVESANFALRGSPIQVRFEIPSDLHHANVDEGQITQVFHNLVLNARQSMPGGGAVTIEAENMNIRAGEPTTMQPGKYVHISVRDEGTGIPEERIHNIFDPFYTTKEKGSGLGLSISYSIVRRHEGHISAESKEGSGSVFHVYLPASAERAEKTGEKAATGAHGRGRVLVIDDEDFVLKVAREMLSSMGYTVETSLTGDRAIELYRRSMDEGERFDCVIIDLTIRGSMGGLEIMAKLKAEDPDVRAVVSSGYSNDPVMADFREHGFIGIVPKPYSYRDLEDIMKSAVNRS